MRRILNCLKKAIFWEFENPTSVTYSSQKQYYHKSGSDRLNSGIISIHLRQVWAEIHFLPLLNWICAIFLTLHSSGIVRKEKKNKTKHRIIIPQYITMYGFNYPNKKWNIVYIVYSWTTRCHRFECGQTNGLLIFINEASPDKVFWIQFLACF